MDRSVIRVGAVALLLVFSAMLLSGYLTASPELRGQEEYWQEAYQNGTQVVEERENMTAVAALGSRVTNGQLIVFDEDGEMEYYNRSYGGYGDVDPAPEFGHSSLLYVGHQELSTSACNSEVRCMQNTIEVVNISTGEVTRLHRAVTPYRSPLDITIENGVRWHDVDIVNRTHVIVADISRDRVFMLDTRTGEHVWSWNAQNAFPLSGGGEYPYDWTHMNDVEYLDDGRVMVSLRNQDQVVFIRPNEGVLPEWTLGSENDHETLYEQHNPDYIPESAGGPAVLVADSENNRVAEYQRTANGWNLTWSYSDARLQWPRDADRLPNDHTLIVDSNGGRVIEVDKSGEIVWSVDIGLPYDAERLETGAESRGGRSAQAAGLESRRYTDPGQDDTGDGVAGLATGFRVFVKSLVPQKVLNGIVFVLPPWMDFFELAAALGLFGTAVVWVGTELRWSRFTPRFPLRSPIVDTDEESETGTEGEVE